MFLKRLFFPVKYFQSIVSCNIVYSFSVSTRHSRNISCSWKYHLQKIEEISFWGRKISAGRRELHRKFSGEYLKEIKCYVAVQNFLPAQKFSGI